jgi:hypothetical protein
MPHDRHLSPFKADTHFFFAVRLSVAKTGSVCVLLFLLITVITFLATLTLNFKLVTSLCVGIVRTKRLWFCYLTAEMISQLKYHVVENCNLKFADPEIYECSIGFW